ncbi:UNVERIFIED_CONTAM: hypothetical protein Sradi_1238400 [Sesamum radiatum]|uniref:Uncharacterized protein n=1 Tax=Sesamum radiatum TaxID=300843 RepID=A0AAW2UMM6_SESRA
MDNQRNLLLNWTYFHQEKANSSADNGAGRYTNESSRGAQNERRTDLPTQRASQQSHQREGRSPRTLPESSVREAVAAAAAAAFRVSSVEDDHKRGMDGFSSSDCDESIVSSPHHLPPPLAEAEPEMPIVVDRPLPEKGKLLQAVMKAGPLLQTLLLAGPCRSGATLPHRSTATDPPVSRQFLLSHSTQ